MAAAKLAERSVLVPVGDSALKASCYKINAEL
jgi:hypothetical protein